ncbi:DUF3313 domain-containing protein, partial [Klebsiella pneumoniae]
MRTRVLLKVAALAGILALTGCAAPEPSLRRWSKAQSTMRRR